MLNTCKVNNCSGYDTLSDVVTDFEVTFKKPMRVIVQFGISIIWH